MRKKARETALRCKRQEEEIHDLSSRISNSQPESDQFKDQLVTLQKRAEAAEAALAQAKADFEKQQASWKAERWDHPDRRLWLEDVPVAIVKPAPFKAFCPSEQRRPFVFSVHGLV
ncbi:hypothetical protein HYQ46_012047 [Verticillium longisporum]|nr:hypothetical protein HYQ46_012047 [Verticillium longisporum]